MRAPRACSYMFRCSLTNALGGAKASSMMKRLAFLAVMLLLAAASAVGPRGPVRGAAAVLLLFLVIGSMIRWLADRSTRLSSSGRDPQDLGSAWSARPRHDYDRQP